MGETLSTCAGGEDHNNNNNKFNKPKFSLKKNNNNVTATRKTKATSHSNNANSSDSDNPFQQYERERISKQALVSKKIDAKEEYELEIARANQENSDNNDSSIPNKNNKTAILNKARKKYIIKLIKIKELASINFQYTLVKQIELEIEAVKKVGGRNIIGNEEFLNVPLEVPKVSFELKEIKNNTPTKDVVHNNVNNNNNKEQQMKNNNNNNNNGSMEDDDDVEEKEIRKKTIKEFPPKIIQPSSTTLPSSHLHQQQPSEYQHQYLTFEEKRNQVWKEDINLRIKKKKEVKSNLHHLLQRQQEKNGTMMTTKKV